MNRGYNGRMQQKKYFPFFLSSRGREELDLSYLCIMAAFGWKWCLCLLCPVSKPSNLRLASTGASLTCGSPTRKPEELPSLDWSQYLRVNIEDGRKKTFFFFFFMGHIKFPHVSANLVRTTKLPDCASGLNDFEPTQVPCPVVLFMGGNTLRQHKSGQKRTEARKGMG